MKKKILVTARSFGKEPKNFKYFTDRGYEIAENPYYGKTIGIIGFGRIGQAVAKRAKGFDMKVLAFDFIPNHAAAEALGVELVDRLEDLLPRCQYVTLHVPKTPETVDLMDRRRIAMMPDGAYLINASRGGVVNEDALYEALQSGKLAGAACDVLAVEPPAERPRLFDCENFVITSHSGGNSIEAAETIARTAAENIMAVIEGRPCDYIVNVVNREGGNGAVCLGEIAQASGNDDGYTMSFASDATLSINPYTPRAASSSASPSASSRIPSSRWPTWSWAARRAAC